MRLQFLVAVVAAGLCSSCTNTNQTSTPDPAGSATPHATLVLRDGTRVKGTVTQSSPSKMTFMGDDKISREIPTEQVKSISYDAPAPVEVAPAPTATTAPVTSAAAPVAAKIPPAVTDADEDAPHEEHYHPPQAVIRTRTYRLAVGTEIPVRAEETVDSSKAVEGQTFAAEVSRDVLDASGAVVIPKGSNALLVIRSASQGGRFKGTSDLDLDLLSVSVEGQKYALETENITERGRDGIGKNKRTAFFTGGGAAVGAIIGAIAGGGKGAAIGGASGAGAGVLTQVLTKGHAVRVPAETVLTFRLEQPLRVVAAR